MAAKVGHAGSKVEKGDANVLVLTSAGHAIVDGQTTQAAIKGLQPGAETALETATSSRFCGPTGSRSGSSSLINPQDKLSICRQMVRL